MNWQSAHWLNAIERTVTGLGYDLVDAEKSAGGLLRVYIDHPAKQPTTADERFISVDDCERVTRQLQHVLEVDNVAYERLEVSSPGLDRPLRKPEDFARFVGEQVDVTLKLPFKGRKHYKGELQAREAGWRLVMRAEPAKPKKGAVKPAAGVADAPSGDLALDFVLEEVKEARLVPVVDFKGRRAAGPASPASTEPRSVDEVEGDRIQ